MYPKKFAAVAMDNYSKVVCLIGALNIVVYLEVAIKLITDVYQYSGSSETFLDYYPGIYSILMASLAALMICGVIMKRHQLLVPFLVISALDLIVETIPVLIEFISKGNLYELQLYKIVLGIVTIYPAYTLFSELRSQYLKEKSLEVTPEVQEKKSAEVLTQNLCA